MSAIDFARVREAFDRSVDMPRGDPRRAALAEALSPAEREELDSLLAMHDAEATRDDVQQRINAAAADGLPGVDRRQRLGPWRITGELGEGGMGVVLSAVRDDGEFDQRAAIKVIRGFSSAAARDRLRRERQILAGLEHPNIARLLDGGSTRGGEPYLVMEFVDGETLPAWLARQPPLRARIRLFASICRAVAFAHQRLVVHRDLKPGNVMVRADGSPVLLDFGIAKLVEDGPAGDGTRTQAMTPAYASPEQLRGEAVTTATHVFGLGLLLYILLGGDVSQRGDPLKAATTSVNAVSEAARRSSDEAVRAFAPQLRGDLDAIVRLATRLEPNRRYASAVLLQQDIEAWLDGRPVFARAGDRWYQFTKFAREYRVVLGVGAVLALAALAFTARLAVERDRAREAEARALQEAATSREVLDFVTGLFGELDPLRGGSEDITARELLDHGRTKLDGVQASGPRARAALQRALGDIYRNSERPEPAIELLTAARGAYVDDPAASLELIKIDVAIAQAYNALLDGAGALPWIEGALARALPLEESDPKSLANVLMTHGVTVQRLGRDDEAMANFERAQLLFARSGPEGREGLASVLHNRGWVAESRGDNAAALDWYQQAAAAKTALLGGDHPSTLNSRTAVAGALAAVDRLAEAEAMLLAVAPDVERRMGAKSSFYRTMWNELGSVRQDLGRYAESAAAYQRALAIASATETGPPSVATAQIINNLATLDEERGDFAAAEPGYRESLAARLRSLPDDSLPVARARHNLARVLLRTGRAEEAAPLVAAALAAREAGLPAGHADRLATQALRVELALERGDIDAANREATQVAAALPASAASARGVAAIQRTLMRVAVARGDAPAREDAARAALAALTPVLPEGHPMIALARLDLADALRARDPREAAALHASAVPVLDAALAPVSRDRPRLRADP